MVQIKTFMSYSPLPFENEINLWIKKQTTAGHSYTIKEIKIYPSEHHYFAYILYDDNAIPATSTGNSTAEMWF